MEFINPKERLPENEEILCVIYTRDDYEFGWWHEGSNSWDSPDCGYIMADEVEGWIPLPTEPPTSK